MINMSLVPKIKSKLHQSGVRGVVASTLRFLANRIDSGVINKNSQITQTSEFLEWVRIAVPGMLGKGNIDAMEYAIANMPHDNPIVGNWFVLWAIHCRLILFARQTKFVNLNFYL
jgi:hypothetical protein